MLETTGHPTNHQHTTAILAFHTYYGIQPREVSLTNPGLCIWQPQRQDAGNFMLVGLGWSHEDSQPGMWPAN